MRIEIFVGTGGVGKTSVAAASALRGALSGEKALVLTIDPARRLRTALGISGEDFQQRLTLDPVRGGKQTGELWAAQLNVAASLNRAVRQTASPKQAEAVLAHPIYHVLLESLAGMQELMAVERIDQAVGDGFEALYLDTAPSRHALEFVDKPEAFSQLVSLPMVRLVGRTYQWWERSGLASLGRKSLELYTRVEEMLGATLTRQILDFFSIFRSVAEDYAKRARHTLALLRDPKVTSFAVVTTPFKAKRDADFFAEELGKRSFPVGALLINRVWPQLPSASLSPIATEMQPVLRWYQDTTEAHHRIAEQVHAAFKDRIPRIIEVPELASDVHGLPALHRIAEHLSVPRP